MKKPANGNWPLYTVWGLILIATIGITRFYRTESSSFYGIAETREIVVNSESAVEICRINVTEGQSVEKGMLLVELGSPELTLKINHISHQLDQLKAQKGVDKSEIKSGIRQLKAEKLAKENEIKNQIEDLENQYRLNKSLISGLKSIEFEKSLKSSKELSPIELRIKNLKKELRLCVNPIKIRISLLEKTLKSSDDPLKIQVERLENELELLNDENGKLNIYARISGIIGSVNFKPGEKVSPFSPILTLHAKTPSFIKGYIYENSYSEISMGDCVDVVSLNGEKTATKGCVIGIGARIVEYPLRLRKHPDLQVWGREVVIQIPEDNNFILGEKTLITSLDRQKDIFKTFKEFIAPLEIAAETIKLSKKFADETLAKPVMPLKTKAIEASAILFLDDIERYLILSDDTPKNAPILFLMSEDGRIREEVIVEGLGKIDDMEALAKGDDNTVYITSSFNSSKKKKNNQYFAAVKRNGQNFLLSGKTDLKTLLKDCADKSPDKDWASFIKKGIYENSLDIEGIFYKDGDIYLGFKAPVFENRSIILRIRDIDKVVSHGNLSPEMISVWRQIILSDENSSLNESISDMAYHNNILYLTGVPGIKPKGKRCGSLWKYDPLSNKTLRLKWFNSLQPEGVTPGKDLNTLMISFDQGRKELSKVKLFEVK